MTKGWHRHRKEHRIARYKGLARRVSNLTLKNSTPEEKALAKQKMIELDPLNQEWKSLP